MLKLYLDNTTNGNFTKEMVYYNILFLHNKRFFCFPALNRSWLMPQHKEKTFEILLVWLGFIFHELKTTLKVFMNRANWNTKTTCAMVEWRSCFELMIKIKFEEILVSIIIVNLCFTIFYYCFILCSHRCNFQSQGANLAQNKAWIYKPTYIKSDKIHLMLYLFSTMFIVVIHESLIQYFPLSRNVRWYSDIIEFFFFANWFIYTSLY